MNTLSLKMKGQTTKKLFFSVEYVVSFKKVSIFMGLLILGQEHLHVRSADKLLADPCFFLLANDAF